MSAKLVGLAEVEEKRDDRVLIDEALERRCVG